jgi:ABC-type lipoprotein release transport system permease subunit
VVSLFVLGQAMARFASVRHADEPVLAALGLTREQRSRAVFLLLAPSLLIGSALAAFVAIMLSPLFPFGVARRADPDPGFHADASVLVVGVAVSLLLAIVLAAFIARRWVVHERGSRHAPAAVSTKLANLGLSPVPLTGVRFALERGGGRSRPPTRSTVAAIVIAMVVVTGALVVRSSIDGLGADPARYGQSWAIAVTTDGDLREIAEKVAQDRRIAAVDLMAQGELDLSAGNDTSAQIGVVGIQGLASPAAVGMLEGRAPSGLGEIALGSVTMRELGVHIGDEIVASGPCGTRRLDVTGRAIVPLVGGDSPDEGAVVTLDSYSELCADQLIAEIDLNRNMLVHLNDDRQLDAVAADLRAEGLDVELSTRPSSVDALFGIREVTAIVSLIVGSLGLAVVTYALLLSVRRRRGELAVLRALGFRPAQTGAVLSAQAATLVVVGIVLGLPLGVIAGRLLWKAIAEPSNVIVRSDVGLIVIVAAVAMAVLIGAVSLWPSWRARRIDVASALRSE